MTPAVWEQIRRRFEVISELTSSERAASVRSLSLEDSNVGEVLRELLDLFQPDDDFLESPPWSLGTNSPRRIFSPAQILAERFEVKEFVGEGDCRRSLPSLRPIA